MVERRVGVKIKGYGGGGGGGRSAWHCGGDRAGGEEEVRTLPPSNLMAPSRAPRVCHQRAPARPRVVVRLWLLASQRTSALNAQHGAIRSIGARRRAPSTAAVVRVVGHTLLFIRRPIHSADLFPPWQKRPNASRRAPTLSRRRKRSARRSSRRRPQPPRASNRNRSRCRSSRNSLSRPLAAASSR